MAISERKRFALTAIAVALVGIVTGLLVGGSLLPSSAADKQSNERTTTTTTETTLVHAHGGSRHTHRIKTVITTTETTPHYTFHQPTTTTQLGTTTTVPTQVRGSNAVLLQDTAYMPTTITVPVGTTVTWTNLDSEDHTVSSDTDLFNNYLVINDTFSYTFTERGTFNYHCEPHPEMLGKVIVE